MLALKRLSRLEIPGCTGFDIVEIASSENNEAAIAPLPFPSTEVGILKKGQRSRPAHNFWQNKRKIKSGEVNEVQYFFYPYLS